MKEPPEESFASLFEKKGGDVPRRMQLRTGDRVEATVLQIGKDAVFVDIDGARQAFIEAQEVRAPDGSIPLKVGDRLTAHVVEIEEGGPVRLGRALGGGGAGLLADAVASGAPVEAKVTGVNKGGVEVELPGARGFCPFSQLGASAEEAKELVGQTIRFVVLEVKDGGKNAIVSRKALALREAADAQASGGIVELGALAEQASAAASGGTTLAVGGVVEGTVERIEAYGVFVQVAGMRGRGGRGLVPNAELGLPRGADVKKAIPLGTKLTLEVQAIGEGKLRLSVAGAAKAAERADFEAARDKGAAPKTLGTFADLLKRRK